MIVTNERGGKRSECDSTPTEFPPIAHLEISRVMGMGEKNYPRDPTGKPNWHHLSWLENLDNGLVHVDNVLSERNKPNRDLAVMRKELSHAAARLCMALEMFVLEESCPNQDSSTSATATQ